MKDVKWIVGYVDGYGKVHHKIVNQGDERDTHTQIWGYVARQHKWRWQPEKPLHINTYGEDMDDEYIFKIYDIIYKYIKV